MTHELSIYREGRFVTGTYKVRLMETNEGRQYFEVSVNDKVCREYETKEEAWAFIHGYKECIINNL